MLVLLILGLLFWGFNTDVLWLGGLLSLLLFVAFLLQAKFDFEPSSFYQVANLGALIVAAIFAFYWLDDRASKAILPTVQLLPLALLPLLILQYLSKQGQVPASAILFFQRGKEVSDQQFDVSILFIFTCLFSAGAMPHEGTAYFTGASALILALLLLLHHRKHVISNVLIVFVFLCAESLGIGFVYGLNDLQSRLEAKINAWILSYNDGNKASTAIGAVGRLKLSDDIIFRVQAKQAIALPMLLREGTYQRYAMEEWYGGAWKSKEVPVVDEHWQLLDKPDIHALQQFTIFQSFDTDKQMLALPSGAAAIEHLAVDDLSIEQGGRVVAQGLPPFAGFDVFYTNKLAFNKTIQRSDFDMPKAEAKSIALLAKKLNLYRIKYEQGEAKVVQVLHDELMRNFTYSTWLQQSKVRANEGAGQLTPLAQFLWRSKTGHCEYFATATVLIFRELGIPARYAVGYSMSEYDKDAGVYVVRGRDAHAWAVAFVDGQWINIDNTPPNWLAIEGDDTPLWQGLNDVVSSWLFAFKKWRYSDDEKDDGLWYWVLAVMFIFLAYRVLSRVKTKEDSAHSIAVQFDEDWLAFEDMLAQEGLGRGKGEPVHVWLMRIHEGQWQALGELYNQRYYAEFGLDAVQLKQFESMMHKIRQSIVKDKND